MNTILFDVMGTLVYDPYLVELPAFFGMSFQELITNKDRSIWPKFECAEISEAEFLEHYFGEATSQIDATAFRDHLRSAYRFLNGTQSLLIELSAAGIDLHAFSNYPDWYNLIESKLTLSRYLQWSFVSCETGFRKPDPAAYQHAITQLGLPAGDIIFVDDRQENVDAADNAGMHGLLYSTTEQLRGELKSLAVLV